MCGIWVWIHKQKPANGLEKAMLAAEALEARGPEGSRLVTADSGTFAFTRLAINGLNEAGMQPFLQNKMTWICNGEIYNSHDLGLPMPSGSDCEVLGPLWKRVDGDAVAFCRALDGVFGLVLYDDVKKVFVVARDPYGVRPLYYSYVKEGYQFASERKVLERTLSEGELIHEFPPGQVWVIDSEAPYKIVQHTYHTVPWVKMADSSSWQEDLRRSLEAAVSKRLLTERPVAALLSGGIDSSLIAALVQRELKKLGKPPLKTFSIGMPGSTDLKYAKMVADFIGSEHTEVLTTADEMFAAIPQVIANIESYDITTVRASVGNWMVAKAIRERSDCKVVFNGDGSDEVFGSYLYFYRAPSDEAFEAESERLLKEISKYDVLRSDRSISSHGLEPRTPFLDKQFVQVARSLPTSLRRPGVENKCEKWALRTAFSDSKLLPEEVLWRRKEAFSDGVSSEQKSWYQEVQERIPSTFSDDKVYEHIQPHTKEAHYYRDIYEKLFTKTGDYWPFWMPRWSGETSDPSARTLSVYTNGNE